MEGKVLDVILQNMPGIAAMLYIIFFQGKEIKAKRADLAAMQAENDKLRLKNEQLYMRIIGHFEAQAIGKRVRISKVPEDAAAESDQN